MLLKSAPLSRIVYEDSAELLYGNAKNGILVTLFASTLLVFGFYTPEIQVHKHIWWACVTLLMAVRMLDAYSWDKTDKSQKYDGKKAVNRFVIGSLTTSLMWCIYCLYVFTYADQTELASIIIVVSALAGGAATILAGHKIAAISYVLIMLAPFSIGLLLSGEHYQQILGLLGVAFCFVMVMTSIKSSEFTSNAIRLKNENAALVEQMEQKVASRTEKIYQLSNLDPLTSLFNRSAFMHHLSQQIELSQQDKITVALLFIDLDGFKKINDSLGHEVGDKLLQQTAKRLEKCRTEQEILCRWGGDEFLIACMGADKEAAFVYAKKLVEKISEHYTFDNNQLSIGATVGIALSPEHSQNADDLILLADTAMYFQKKRQPRSVAVFDQEMGKHIQRERELKTGLIQAIDKNQLRMVYQPIVLSGSGEVQAFESLLRWNFNGENIPPDEFIQIAEQYGLINTIGDWVLQQSCIKGAKWGSESNNNIPSVSVNVSVLQLSTGNFINVVNKALEVSNLPPQKLIIEITESIFAEDKASVLKQIKQLQAMGIKVSLDDFGTEYSSLSVIQDLAVNTIKIDRSFVKDLNPKGLAIIQAIIHMARALDYAVIAEGVETQEQAEVLTKLGVEMLQGYYFSKPMEADTVEQYLTENSI